MNKIMNKSFWSRIVLVALVGAVSIAFTQCLGGRPPEVVVNNINIDDIHGDRQQISLDSNAAGVGVKDFEQLVYTMAEVTGVDMDSDNANVNNLRNRWNDTYHSMLPDDVRLDAFMPAQQLTVSKVAAGMCQALLENAAWRSAIWPTHNFGQNFMLQQAQREDFIVKMLDRFWGRNVHPQVVVDESFEAINELIQQASTEGSTSLNAAKIACTAALASAPIIYQ
jgi:hypothetical protein